MKIKLHIAFFSAVCFLALTMFSCDQTPPEKQKNTEKVIIKKIPRKKPEPEKQVQPAAVEKPVKKIETDAEKQVPAQPSAGKIPDKDSEKKEEPAQQPQIVADEHYEAQGKIDPFKPLVQDRAEAVTPAAPQEPQRILTPLEKLELSQIRLVAVILMKDRQIAMVEDPTGKGYEVQIGTYIGKNSGRVAEIRQDRLIVKELVRNFRGKLSERVQELKINKKDGEE
eukprot:Anaeramoba_ignava/a91494_8.p2 GENE.a91494_8~~a91494_8.p2  ORF type:complete len:225 (-),score=10.96 a91494_8:78-752(-)